MTDSLISLTLAIDVDISETEAALKLAADSEMTADWLARAEPAALTLATVSLSLALTASDIAIDSLVKASLTLAALLVTAD